MPRQFRTVALKSWMDGVLDDVVAVIVGLAVVMPGLMPPPAIQMVEAAAVVIAAVVVFSQHALAVTVRPNSPPQMTSVSSSKPLFQVEDQSALAGPRPGTGRDLLGRLLCWSQPRCKSCTKRTPRSIMRRPGGNCERSRRRCRGIDAVHIQDVSVPATNPSVPARKSARGTPFRTARSEC